MFLRLRVYEFTNRFLESSQCNSNAWTGRYATCNTATKDECTYDSLAVGYCPLSIFGSCLPTYFQNIAGNCSLSGSDAALDYCPLVAGYSNAYCNDATQSRDPAFGESYGVGSKCVRSSLVRIGYVAVSEVPRCFPIRCIGPDLEVIV